MHVHKYLKIERGGVKKEGCLQREESEERDRQTEI